MRFEPFVARYAVCLIGLIATAGVGCGTTAHDDHLEHHVPEHKPHDLADAVDEMEKRWQALESKWATNPGQSSEALSELIDIIRWLPELAGDSDLPESEWNEVNAISKNWQAKLTTLKSNSNANSEQSFPSWDAVNPQMAELRQIAPLAKTGHAHSHHGHSHD